MSVNKQFLRKFAAFLKTYGYSQHHAAEVLSISQPSLSKLLSGITDHISDKSLQVCSLKMQAWIDKENQDEAMLYERLAPLCRGVRRQVLNQVFISIIRDM